MFLTTIVHLGLNCFRNSFGRIAASIAIVGFTFSASSAAYAQGTYPTKSIRLVVGFAAGGPTDIIARVVGASLGKALGEQIYIENRAGASGNLATEAVARAEPDGYTLMLTPLSTAVNESLFKNFKYRVADHFEPVALLAQTSLVLLVHPTLNVKSVPDLIALAKAKPDDVLYASAGKGTATHLAAELFNTTAGTKMVAVHYKGGGETIKDLLSGQVKVMFSTIPPVLGFVQEGRLRGLATTAPTRDKNLPELPTIAEAGLPGYDVQLWFGMTVPKGTPRSVIDKLAAAVTKALDDPDTRRALTAQGYTSLAAGPEAFGKFYRNEVAKWAKVVDAIGTLGN